MTEEWGGGELELDGDGRKLSPVALVITRWKRRWIEQKKTFTLELATRDCWLDAARRSCRRRGRRGRAEARWGGTR